MAEGKLWCQRAIHPHQEDSGYPLSAHYLQQYPALADVIFIPPEITLGTWDDLAVLTWDDASAYTWNEIGGN